MAGIQAQAGVLTRDGKRLTTNAKKRFIDDTIAELRSVSGGAALPCDIKLPTTLVDDDQLEQLHDPKMFPDFHARFLGDNGTYTLIAKALDVQGARPFFPIVFDPIAFALQIPNVKVPKLEIPDILLLLAMLPNLQLMLPKLGIPELKIPKLLTLPPIPIPQLPQIPKFDIDLKFDALIKFNFKMLELPIKIMIPGLVIDPKIALEFPNLPKVICKLAGKALEGIGPAFVAQIAATKVLMKKTIECVEFDVIGLTMGSVPPESAAPGVGLVGLTATERGLGIHSDEEKAQADVATEKANIETKEKDARANAVKLAQAWIPAEYKTARFDAITGVKVGAKVSTCGFWTSFVLYRLGCRDKLIVNRNDPAAGLKYQDGQNIGMLRNGGKKRGAWMQYASSRRPEPGDIVLIDDQLDTGGKVKKSDGTTFKGKQTVFSGQHVFMLTARSAQDDGTELWFSADAGLGGIGTQSAGFVTRQFKDGRLFSAKSNDKMGKYVLGWLDISKLEYAAPPDLSGPPD